MHANRRFLFVIAAILLWSVGCIGGASDPSSDTEFSDLDTDAGMEGDIHDGDTHISSDTDEIDARDASEDIETGDVSPPEDTRDTGVDTDVDTTPLPTPDDWDCAPDLPLDAERYADLKELDATEFSIQLQQRVDNHNGRGYDAARTFMFETLEVRDDGKLECVYTHDRVEPDGTNLPGGLFNTEHTWPQSRGADTEPARSDVHHLFPVEIHANNERANYEFGHVDCDESSCPWHRDGSFLGPSADDDRDPIFEVRPERRGDIARAILYFSLRYEEPVSPQEEAVLRQWNCEDPPDDYERNRNDAIESFQQNRNPFIDRPDFVDRIEVF